MRNYWKSLFGLNYKISIWVEQDDLGKEKVIKLKNKRYAVMIPQKINNHIVLRLRGLGRTKDNKTGDFLLKVQLNKGEDHNLNLWLSETSAKNGGYRIVAVDGKRIRMFVPPNSYHELTIRLKGLGEILGFNWRAPFLDRKRGNLLVKLFVYPDNITPKYGTFDMLTTEDMALEGWVYQKIDEVIQKIDTTSLPMKPLLACVIADLFNDQGWTGILHAFVDHLKLNHLPIELEKSDSTSKPGSCQKTVFYRNNIPVANKYRITINEQFLDNPFSIAAILAHELCHVVYSERIDKGLADFGRLNDPGHRISPSHSTNPEKNTLEEERTVDLLVFMFKIGEFQLRVARDKRLTLGYFHQEIFERMQVIVAKKLNFLDAAP